MKSLRYCALLTIVAFCNLLSVSAQGQAGGGGGGAGRGNFDPAQMRERMMARVREEMDVKDDADWKPISDRVTKVMDAQREARSGGGMGMMFRPRRNANGDQGGDQAAGGGRRGGGPGGFGQVSPEHEALQKSLENKASNDEVKAALAKYRESHKAKQDKLLKAQDDLKKVLSMRQEAAAVSLGLLD
jgi:hypothetical protein